MSDSIGLVYSPEMCLHRMPNEHHPENPDRLYEIYKMLLNEGLAQKMIPVKIRKATIEELCLAHSEKYIKSLNWKLKGPNNVRETVPNRGDIFSNKYTLRTIKLAAGSTLELVKMVIKGKLRSGFAAVRPPGHHATKTQAGGFCFCNNLAIAAIYSVRLGKRVLIVDWDVHLGNGTEDIVRDLDNILFFSVHRHDYGTFYPMTGKSERYSNIIKIGFNGSPKGDDEYLKILKTDLLPIAKSFAPDLILVSAGFDAAKNDPLGQYNVTPDCYYEMTRLLLKVCPSMVLILEGGYDLVSTPSSAACCVKALFDYTPDKDEDEDEVLKLIEKQLEEANVKPSSSEEETNSTEETDYSSSESESDG